MADQKNNTEQPQVKAPNRYTAAAMRGVFEGVVLAISGYILGRLTSSITHVPNLSSIGQYGGGLFGLLHGGFKGYDDACREQRKINKELEGKPVELDSGIVTRSDFVEMLMQKKLQPVTTDKAAEKVIERA